MKTYGELTKIAAAASFLLAAQFGGVWKMFGAHPLWSAGVTFIGLAIGLVAILLIWQKPSWGMLALLALLTALAFQTSTAAKVVFVGSYADNAYAGTVWYYGFIFFIAGLFTVLSGLLRRLVSAKAQP